MKRIVLVLGLCACAEPTPPPRSPLVLPTSSASAPATVASPPSTAAPSTPVSAAPESAAPASAATPPPTLGPLAGPYTRFIDDLAERLRTAPPYPILRQLGFHRIRLAGLGPATTVPGGIERRVQVKATQSGPQIWLEQLFAWERAGWVIDQTALTHTAFETGPPARSIVAFEASVRREGRRAILRGDVQIIWRKGKPYFLECRDVRLVERAGDSIFEEIQRIPLERAGPVLIADLDADARPELLVPALNARFSRTEGGYVRAPLAKTLPASASAVVTGDFDGDGRYDLMFAADVDARPVIALLRGADDAHFHDAPTVIFERTSAAPVRLAPADVDGDGDLDVRLFARGAQALLRNLGRGRFEAGRAGPAVAEAATIVDLLNAGVPARLSVEENRIRLRPTSVDDHAYVYGLAGAAERAWATDLDADGRTDVVLVEPGDPPTLRVLRNMAPRTGHWLGVRVAGPAAGARLTVESAPGTQTVTLSEGDSRDGQVPAAHVFGLGTEAAVQTVRLRWVDGRERVLSAPALGRWHRIAPP